MSKQDGRRWAGLGDSEGGSLVESLIAFAIFGMAAVALYPLMISVKKQSKYGDSRQLCQNIIRGKLDEYRFGRAVNLAEEATAAARPEFNLLTVPTLSDTAVSGMSTGGSAPTTTTLGNGGFVYSKLRYNLHFPGICTGLTSTASLLTWAPTGTTYSNMKALGVRECVGDNTAFNETATAEQCLTGAVHAPDRRVRNEIPGFKMYVKLELETPWKMGVAAPLPAARASQFDNKCPDAGLVAGGFAPNASLYDFDGAGDAIRVTVTGLMDFPSTSTNIKEFAGLPWDSASPTTYQGNIPRWMCTAAAVVRPELPSVRYYVSGADSRVYNISGHGANGQWGAWAFASLYRQVGATTLLAMGRQSIAVHPRNLSVYILKPGKIIRYSNCGGYPIDCISTGAADGVSDDGTATRPNVQEFEVLGSVFFIGVDFRSGMIYGMGRDMSDVVKITLNGGAMVSTSTSASVNLAGMGFDTVTEGEFPKLAGRPGSGGTGMGMRLKGFFIDPGGGDFFYVDAGTNTMLTGNASWTSIYRGIDGELSSPILTLPIDSVAFSK